jgi:N-methylhydantoinase B
VPDIKSHLTSPNYDPARLEVFKYLFAAVAEEMGVVLRKASYSPNIKERRDFSCALFDARGNMIAQAAHIPVHLGSMPMSVIAAIRKFMVTGEHAIPGMGGKSKSLKPGDVIILNDPYAGGTHLPDITMVTPVFIEGQTTRDEKGQDTANHINHDSLFGFVASRAHHADVGGITAGSMAIAREIYQEGLIIPPVKLLHGGEVDNGIIDMILANVRTPEERLGDLWAQIASNQRGAKRLQEIVARYGRLEVSFYMAELLAYTERMTRHLLSQIPDGIYSFTDFLDEDGMSSSMPGVQGGNGSIPISVAITIQGDQAIVDFSGSAHQQDGSINAVYAITLSAVYYVFRCLIGLDVPNNSGCLVPIKVIAPQGTVVNATHPAAVAAGNVETSQRIVDVLLGAFSKAFPDRIPAASQGTMNNLTIGGKDLAGRPFTYYETIAGGMGARPDGDGPSGVHSHMTNTLNTPIEAFEYAYPMRVLRYEIRHASGGEGRFRGGDGIRRDVQVLVNAQASLLTERRVLAPYGLWGGKPGKTGENVLIRSGVERKLPGKCTIDLQSGDILSIRTPGGGGFGANE